MTDEQIADFLGLREYDNWQALVDHFTPLQRKTYERMADLVTEIDLWQAGLGPRPRGVLIDEGKRVRARQTPQEKEAG